MGSSLFYLNSLNRFRWFKLCKIINRTMNNRGELIYQGINFMNPKNWMKIEVSNRQRMMRNLNIQSPPVFYSICKSKVNMIMTNM